ncbi:MAG: PspC domain-containing protein [Melioribacteraceae bacterium]|nr:PspC domain-containing protein [Melioribacteraceae bacterium]
MAEKLYRSRRKKMIGGVSAGLGEYLNVDPVLIRVLFVILTIINPLTLLAYIILWIVVEEEPYRNEAFEMGSGVENQQTNDTGESRNEEMGTTGAGTKSQHSTQVKEGRGKTIAGIILIAIGFIFLAEQWFPRFDFEDIFPYALVGVGAWLIYHSMNKNKRR